MDGLFDMRYVVGSCTCSRTCCCKSEEKQVEVRRDSFPGSPQGPLCRCGTDFQGRLVKSSGGYVC